MKDTTLIIVALIVAIIFIGPTIFQGLGNLGRDLENWVRYGWEDQTPTTTPTEDGTETDGQSGTNGDGGSGTLGVGVIVHYTDGSTQEVSPEGSVFGLPMSVYFQDQEVDYFEWALAAAVQWEGTLTYLKVSGTMRVKSTQADITLRSEGVLKEYWEGDINNNRWFEIWSFTLDAEEINYSLEDGDHTLEASADITFAAMFASGSKSTSTASPSATLPVTIQSDQIIAIMCDIQPAIFTT